MPRPDQHPAIDEFERRRVTTIALPAQTTPVAATAIAP
jgi:hypothetical protein